jgi:hypothetical protein
MLHTYISLFFLVLFLKTFSSIRTAIIVFGWVVFWQFSVEVPNGRYGRLKQPCSSLSSFIAPYRPTEKFYIFAVIFHCARFQDFTVDASEPKVQLAFYSKPGECPRKIEIER